MHRATNADRRRYFAPAPLTIFPSNRRIPQSTKHPLINSQNAVRQRITPVEPACCGSVSQISTGQGLGSLEAGWQEDYLEFHSLPLIR